MEKLGMNLMLVASVIFAIFAAVAIIGATIFVTIQSFSSGNPYLIFIVLMLIIFELICIGALMATYGDK